MAPSGCHVWQSSVHLKHNTVLAIQNCNHKVWRDMHLSFPFCDNKWNGSKRMPAEVCKLNTSAKPSTSLCRGPCWTPGRFRAIAFSAKLWAGFAGHRFYEILSDIPYIRNPSWQSHVSSYKCCTQLGHTWGWGKAEKKVHDHQKMMDNICQFLKIAHCSRHWLGC